MTKPRTSRVGKSRTEPILVNTLTQFISEVTNYASKSVEFKCYRGQRDSSWVNLPALFRCDLRTFAQHEKRATRDLIAVHPSEFVNDATMFDRLVRMQHYGLPTRLMDVSRNPLIALYFATNPGPPGDTSSGRVTAFKIPNGREKYYDSDTVSCISNLANLTHSEKLEIIRLREERAKNTPRERELSESNNSISYKRLHQFIRSEKPYFLPIIKPIDLFKPYYVHPKMSNRRVVAQAGGFIIYGLQSTKKIRYSEPIEEFFFDIPYEHKEPIRNSLEILGINESHIFPEIEKDASRIRARYHVDRDPF